MNTTYIFPKAQGFPLTWPLACRYSGDPNQMKLGNGFSELFGRMITEIKSAGYTLSGRTDNLYNTKGSFVRPESREAPVAHLARERTRLPFCFLKSQPNEASHV